MSGVTARLFYCVSDSAINLCQINSPQKQSVVWADEMLSKLFSSVGIRVLFMVNLRVTFLQFSSCSVTC